MLTTGKNNPNYSQATEKMLECFSEYSISKSENRQDKYESSTILQKWIEALSNF